MRRALASSFTFLLILPVAANCHADSIRYDVAPDAANKQFRIVMTVPGVKEGKVRIQIPAWSPGAYIIGNYSANIAELAATDAKGSPLDVRHPDKLTWEIDANGAEKVKITYAVTNSDVQSVDGKPKRAHLSGPRSYMYVVGRKEEPAELKVSVPDGWKVATSLDPGKEAPVNAGGTATLSFTAPNYDVLADAPLEMGDFAEQNFEVRGVPHRVVLYGDYAHADQGKLKEYCQRVAESQIGFFNDAPMRRYVFMFRFSGPGGRGAGGLEHLGSTEIGVRGAVDDVVRSVIAHEYFHLWNVKRIRPAGLGPFDYTQPVRTNNLWWSEGVTSYYGDLLSRRAGVNTDEEYFKHLAETVTLLQNTPARLKVTADESSYKVWDGGGSQGFGRLSYYTKGELIGLLLDLKIREVTRNLRSLDDVMRSLYLQCRKGNGPGFEEDAIRTTVSQVAGQDLSGYYDKLCRSTEEMPFAEALASAGLTVAPSDKTQVTGVVGMFADTDAATKSIRVRRVTPESAAATAGLKSGDKIVAIDSKPAIEQSALLLRDPKPGATYKLSVDRDGLLSDMEITVAKEERKVWTVTPVAAATPAQMRLRTKWLNGK
jgi:predicted metalloprotease with PDZ domain